MGVGLACLLMLQAAWSGYREYLPTGGRVGLGGVRGSVVM